VAPAAASGMMPHCSDSCTMPASVYR
jgi:hypothetical protein